MATLRTSLLQAVNAIRGGVPGALDLRQISVTLRVVTWTGSRPGVGTPTTIETPILNAGYNPKVVEVSTRDIIASNGKYQSGDFRVEPITPEYLSGGTDTDTLDPVTTGAAREVFFILRGPPFPADGALCKRVDDDTDSNFRYSLTLRRMGVKP